jgi:hypothetical protein
MEIVSLSNLTSDSLVFEETKKIADPSQSRKVLAKSALSSLFTEATVNSLFSEKEKHWKA